MQFFSTRDQNRKVTSSQAIAQGLSDEGGLFVPESFPQVDVKALCGLDYPALAAAVVREYLTDYDPAFLTDATRSTYGAAFGGKAGYLAPVEGDTYALELWHGPTSAFKDMALQCLPRFFSASAGALRDCPAAPSRVAVAELQESNTLTKNNPFAIARSFSAFSSTSKMSPGEPSGWRASVGRMVPL